MIKYFKIFIIALLPIGVNAQVTFNSTLMDSVDISTYVQLTNNENHKSLFYSKYALSLILQRGDLILGQGNFAKAEEYYRQAALLSSQISDSVLTKRLPFGESIYESEIHLGNLYLATNNMRKAEFYFNSALEIKQKNLPKRSVFIVNAYIGLGNVHIKKGQVDKALFYFTEGEDLLNRAFSTNYDYNSLRREIQINIYEILLAKKEYNLAAKYLRQFTSGGRYNSSYAEQIPTIFELNARYYLATNDFKNAAYYLDRAKLYLRGRSFSATSFRISRTELLLNWAKGDIEKAARVIQNLIITYKSFIIKNFPSMSEYERESFYSTFKEDFEIFNSFAIQNQNHERMPLLLESMYNNQLFGKALLLNEINKLKSKIHQSNDEGLQNALLEWEELKSKLASLYYMKKVNLSLVRSTEDRIIELEKMLSTKTNFLDESRGDVAWHQVQDKLLDSEAAVEIIRVRKYNIAGGEKLSFSDSIDYAFLVIDKNSTFPHLIKLSGGYELETKYLNYYRNSIIVRHIDTLSYNKFWRPVSKILGKYSKIFLSADGIYNQINLNSLLNPATGKYLGEENELILVTNTKDLLKKRNKISNVGSLYGRPNFKKSKSTDDDEPLIEVNNTKRTIENEVIQTFREQDFKDLPATQLEIEEIRDLLTSYAWDINSAMGGEATEERIKKERSPGVLHIATHGFFLKQEYNSINSMIRSGLVLSDIIVPSNMKEDGVLTAYEVTSLNLDSTYLVVLSACETGLGEIKNGEGVYGLQRGFNVAGARYLLMSLWKVDDFATSMLMGQFYNNWLKTGNIHQAFTDAQQFVRADYPHPYYWGSFILLGN